MPDEITVVEESVITDSAARLRGRSIGTDLLRSIAGRRSTTADSALPSLKRFSKTGTSGSSSFT